MNRYNLPCTEEQTEKAMQLGAPIEESCGLRPATSIDGIIYDIPTAEQMIGWLEEQGILIDIDTEWNKSVLVYVWNCENKSLINNVFHGSRKETIIAAIDAALEYLMTKKINNER